ncbi:MAG: AAA family ATPase [Gemmataceae bacterium]
MNLAPFGLTRRPFRPTPDTDAYFSAPSHDAALAGLRQAFAARDGLALVDGDPGSGKTLVALKFLEGLDADVPRVLVPAARFARPADLLQAILFDLGAEYRGLTETELRLSVTEQLLTKLVAGGPTVVVLDEAQHLSDDLLEEVRLLGNLETRSAKAAFVVLVAQPSLRARLGQPDLAAVAQRIGVRCRLEPLAPDESAGYLRHQLRAAGGDPDELLTEEAAHLLAVQCSGVPRVLNQAAALALTLAGDAGEQTVDVEAAVEALARLGRPTDLPDAEPAKAAKPARVKVRLPRRKSA